MFEEFHPNFIAAPFTTLECRYYCPHIADDVLRFRVIWLRTTAELRFIVHPLSHHQTEIEQLQHSWETRLPQSLQLVLNLEAEVLEWESLPSYFQLQAGLEVCQMHAGAGRGSLKNTASPAITVLRSQNAKWKKKSAGHLALLQMSRLNSGDQKGYLCNSKQASSGMNIENNIGQSQMWEGVGKTASHLSLEQ